MSSLMVNPARTFSLEQDRGKTAGSSLVGLRRLDWRYLLPGYSPSSAYDRLTLLGGPAGLEHRALEIGLAKEVSNSWPAAASDAVAALSDSPLDPVSAANCLQPGGVFYCEVDRRLPAKLLLTPAKLSSQLKKAGLEITGSYVVRPGFSSAEAYIPLEPPGALGWYMSTQYAAERPFQILFETWVRFLARLQPGWAAWLFPCFAITAAKAPIKGRAASVLSSPRMQARSSALEPQPVLLTPGLDGGNRAILLPFNKKDSDQPAKVIKIAKLPGFNNRNENEREALRQVRLLLAGEMLESLPLPLDTVRFGEASANIESFLPGSSLLRLCSRWGKRSMQKINDMETAAHWLIEFHRAVAQRQDWDASCVSRWIELPQSIYRDRFGLITAEEELFLAARQAAISMVGVPFPVVWQHRDFNVWNISRNGSHIAVLDWEGARIGPPLCDLLHLITHWHDASRRLVSLDERLAGFETLFFGQERGDPLVEAAWTAIDRYMEQVGVDRRFLPLLINCLWVELSVRRAEQQQDSGAADPGNRQANLFVKYVELLSRHSRELFGAEFFVPGRRKSGSGGERHAS